MKTKWKIVKPVTNLNKYRIKYKVYSDWELKSFNLKPKIKEVHINLEIMHKGNYLRHKTNWK